MRAFGFFQTKRSQLPDLSGISEARRHPSASRESSRNPNRNTHADARHGRQRAPTAPHYHTKFARTATQRSRRMVDKHTGSLQGPDPPPPLPNPTTLHRSGPPADFVHMTGRPHPWNVRCSARRHPQYSHRPRDRRLDEVDDAFMRGRFGRLSRLGRLRATATPPLSCPACASPWGPPPLRSAIPARISREII